MEYYDVYMKRLNRFGTDYQSRIQGQREKVFEDLLLKSVYRVDFVYNDEMVPGLKERYKQDETETMQYLLTRVDMDIPAGTILQIQDKNGNEQPWLVYWLETIKASGYNRYIILKMTHFIQWSDADGAEWSSWAYMYGQQNNMLKDELKSRSRMDTIYDENLKSSFFILPLQPALRKDTYLEITTGGITEAYRVTGYDIQSTPGVEYVTVDPIYLYDRSPTPTQTKEDDPDDFYWLNGGEA